MTTRTFNDVFYTDYVPNGTSLKAHKKSKSAGDILKSQNLPSIAEPHDRSTPSRGRIIPTGMSDALNVIIPIGGIGSRFQKAGYRFPKPLINIVGRPMICWLIEKLSLLPEDTLWVAINEDVENEFQVGQLLKKWFPKLDARLLPLKYLTKGATETLFIVTQSMSAEHLNRRTVSLDCDTIYFTDILSSVRSLPPRHGACFYFEDNGQAPIFSYIRTDKNELITEIQEKRAISNKANSGAYVFPSAKLLRNSSASGIDSTLNGSNAKYNTEYFTSLLIAQMIRNGVAPFLGTPEIPGDYSTCPPIWRNIQLVRQLHEAGHHIIIQTARRMKTHKGNVGAVIADIGTITFQSLERYGIPYDEVFFGKPWADVYVDDLAVHANMDTRREIGWIAEDEEKEKSTTKTGIVAPRSFNHVQVVGDRFIKSSKSNALLGEMYFYSRVPDALADLFPKLYSMRYESETATYSITMQWLKGVTYSHLLVGRSLTAGRFQAFLTALHRIHNAPSHSTLNLDIPADLQGTLLQGRHSSNMEDTDIYANYGRKLRQRYNDYHEDYEALGPGTRAIAQELMERLDNYEHNKRGIPAQVIHGDPVFSNVLLDETHSKVYFFDVRAMQGDQFALRGDVCYDLAKVFQSLQGYDHALLRAGGEDSDGIYRSSSCLATPEPESTGHDRHLDKGSQRGLWLEDIDQRLLSDLQVKFWDFVEASYPAAEVRREDIISITASLLFSLIPLHRGELRPLFWEMCKSVLVQGNNTLRP
ncbi:MAG: hypothetical protein Q9217_001928 [Psora testacea]